MPKNIVICSDGTGNADVKGRGTNVFKLFEAIDLNGHRTDPRLDPQLAFYDDGVGTENFKPLKILGGGAGLGLARNVRRLYQNLARVYDPGDRIFLFGFSRGSFTVRTLTGMIAHCGILNGSNVAQLPTAKKLEDAVDATYDAYRAGYDSYLTRFVGWMLSWPDRAKAVADLHATYPFHPPARIAFIGCWDTVDAVGTPFALSAFINMFVYQFKFRTQDLSPSVDRACHALSIDDKRESFTPVLWTEAPGDKRIEQVWFAGAHSNVGGGYPKQGMSLVAFDWMLNHAMNARLRVRDLDRALYLGHASVDDKLYDPRAGAGVFYRWKPREISALCSENGVKPKIHVSVLERIAHATEDYAPGNLSLTAEVVFTPTGDADADASARTRVEAVQKVLFQTSRNGPDLLGHVRSQIRLGHISYWTFMAAWALLLIGAIGVTAIAPTNPVAIGKSAVTVLKSVINADLGALSTTLRALVVSPWRVTLEVALIGFVAAWYLSHKADGDMSNVFSSFWHQRQADLRHALKQARARAQMRLTSTGSGR